MEYTYVTLATNFNHKMGCDFFVHVSLAPPVGLPESYLVNTMIKVIAADASHPPVMVKLIDLYRTKLASLSGWVTYASHGLDLFDFIIEFKKQVKEVNTDTQVAIYIYKKIDL